MSLDEQYWSLLLALSSFQNIIPQDRQELCIRLEKNNLLAHTAKHNYFSVMGW